MFNLEQTRQDVSLYCWKLLRTAGQSVSCLRTAAKIGPTQTLLPWWNWTCVKDGYGLSARVSRSQNAYENWNTPGTAGDGGHLERTATPRKSQEVGCCPLKPIVSEPFSIDEIQEVPIG